MSTQFCKTCFEEKPLSEFYFRKENGKHKTICKKCVIAGKKIIRDPENKTCKHCGISKPFSEYQKAGGGKWLQPYCKVCDSLRKQKWIAENRDHVLQNKKDYYKSKKNENSNYCKEQYQKYKENIKNRSRIYHHKHRDEILRGRKDSRRVNKELFRGKDRDRRLRNHEKYKSTRLRYMSGLNDEMKERIREKQREYYRKNSHKINNRSPKQAAVRREKKRIWCNRMAKINPSFKILKNLRGRARFALLKDGAVKSNTTENLLGCTIIQFRTFFESKFKQGMNWAAFMKGEIHIDHIIPCCKFDLNKEEDQRKCFHYTNLQPLWWYDNLKKGDKIL